MTTIRRDGESEADFEARQNADRKRESQAAMEKASQERKSEAARAEAVKAKAPAVEPVKELTQQERLEALLTSIRHQVKHNAPIPGTIMQEMEAVVTLGRADKRPLIRHDFARHSLVEVDGKVTMIHTVEEGLDFVRALPAEVRDRPHWREAERRLLLALDSGEPSSLNFAQSAFEAALTEDRRATPLDREPDPRLPDGRIREDRFADRRVPVAPVPEPQPAA